MSQKKCKERHKPDTIKSIEVFNNIRIQTVGQTDRISSNDRLTD